MPKGYDRWFSAYRKRCDKKIDACFDDQHDDCEPSEHLFAFYDQLNAQAVRTAEIETESVWQFPDGTIYAENTGILHYRAVRGKREYAAMNDVLNNDWHNEDKPAPQLAPITVRSKRSKQRQKS